MADVQQNALQLLIGLRAYRPVWDGALLLSVGLCEAGRALALASLAAGAAGLFLVEDHAALRTSVQEGSITYSVTTLAEAVRILKNEVRRSSAVSVGLRMAPELALEEMVRRGLQPDALAFSRPATAREHSFADHLRLRGATMLGGVAAAAAATEVDLQQQMKMALGTTWHIGVDSAVTLQQRHMQDRELLAMAELQDVTTDPIAPLAAEWLRIIPSLQPRALTRSFLQPRLVATATSDSMAGPLGIREC